MQHRALFLVILGILIAGIAGHNYIKYYVSGDYDVYAYVPCDPASFSCFVTSDQLLAPNYPGGTYAKLTIRAHNAPSCLDEHTCTSFTCPADDSTCSLSYCSTDTLEDGESCVTGSTSQ